MGWLPNGYVACDTCGLERVCVQDRALATQMLRASRWRHMVGKTLGGKDFEAILCPGCAHDERKRSRIREQMIQDELPLNWEEGRIVVRQQGVSSR